MNIIGMTNVILMRQESARVSPHKNDILHLRIFLAISIEVLIQGRLLRITPEMSRK
jgi:hypothetical protein